MEGFYGNLYFLVYVVGLRYKIHLKYHQLNKIAHFCIYRVLPRKRQEVYEEKNATHKDVRLTFKASKDMKVFYAIEKLHTLK